MSAYQSTCIETFYINFTWTVFVALFSFPSYYFGIEQKNVHVLFKVLKSNCFYYCLFFHIFSFIFNFTFLKSVLTIIFVLVFNFFAILWNFNIFQVDMPPDYTINACYISISIIELSFYIFFL